MYQFFGFMIEINIYSFYSSGHLITNNFIMIFLRDKKLTQLSDYLRVSDSKNIFFLEFIILILKYTVKLHVFTSTK